MSEAPKSDEGVRTGGPARGIPPHPFEARPHRTLLGLSVPVLISLIAEPVTGLVDTAFVARLGAEALAALGVGTLVLSSSLWIFSFLGAGTQTQVAQALGQEEDGEASGGRGGRVFTTALTASLLCSAAIITLGLPLAPALSSLMGAEGAVAELATTYIRYRLLGVPAVLMTLTAFGALRGVQDMKTPLWVALGLNALNVVLDVALIPSLGVGGAALATSLSQWAGAGVVLALVGRRLGLGRPAGWGELAPLFRIGRDLFLRTGLLSLFLLLGTRKATLIGADAGAAHQAVRQIWLFSALFLDAFAVSGQSLVGYFLGSGRVALARRVAAGVVGWSMGTGALIGLAMLLLTPLVRVTFVPPEAMALFGGAWLIAALSMPLNGLTFGTDGIHLGTGDFGWMRDGMILSTLLGALGLGLIPPDSAYGLELIWGVTAGWIGVRGIFGMVRVWPGVGRAPLGVREGARKRA